LYDDGEYKEAIIKLFEGLRLAKAREEISEACLYLSLSYYSLGDTSNCLANLKKLFEVEPRRSVDESYFPSDFMALFNKTKDEVAKQAATKPPEKVEEKKIEEKKAGEKTAEEKKAEEKKAVKEEKPPTVEKPKEEEKKPVAVGGKPTQETQVKKKKFPFLIVAGVVVAAGVLAVLLLKKKTSAPPGPQYGNISITSNPTGAKVYLDGVDQGKTTDCTLTNIPVGSHTLKLELENYGKWEGSVEVIAGQTTNVSATLAGYTYEFVTKWGSQGSGDGQFNWPEGVAVDSSGYVYVADEWNNRIQKFTSSGGFVTKWGNYGSGDGQFYKPRGVAVDSSGYVYVADTENHRIQKFRITTETQQQARISYTSMNVNPLKFAPLPGPERMNDSLLTTVKDSQNLPIKKRVRDKN